MIGVDPHKASHAAVVISAAEEPLGQVGVRAGAAPARVVAAGIMWRCCGSGASGTGTWAGRGLNWCAGCLRCCELLPGGFSKEVTAGQAAQLLASIPPGGAVAAARRELAAQFVRDLRGTDAQMRDTKKKLTLAVRAAGPA